MLAVKASGPKNRELDQYEPFFDVYYKHKKKELFLEVYELNA